MTVTVARVAMVPIAVILTVVKGVEVGGGVVVVEV